MWTRTRKRIAAIGAAVLMAGAATTALAYFVAGPTGSTTSTGTAVTAPTAQPVTITETDIISTPYQPGVTDVVQLLYRNVGTSVVRLSGTSMTWASNRTGCDPGTLPGTFTFAFDPGNPGPLPFNLNPNQASQREWDITMNDDGQDQSACEGATFTFTYTAS
jgi:hypothetical protein